MESFFPKNRFPSDESALKKRISGEFPEIRAYFRMNSLSTATYPVW